MVGQRLTKQGCKVLGSISPKRREQLDFYAENMWCLHIQCLVPGMTLFQRMSFLDAMLFLILTSHSQLFERLREIFYTHALWHLEPVRSEKKGFYLGKRLAGHFLHLEGLWLAGTLFRRERHSQNLN